jgi:dihydroflavonol-4-reductase
MTDDRNALSTPTVLVTGGSGFLGSWAVVKLLVEGYQVRTTVRRSSREDDVRSMIAPLIDTEAQARLHFHEADLLKDKGWKAAAEGVDFVLHVASPMPIGEYRGQDVITPAREGTRRVLEAALAGGVRRVVLTSSTQAATPVDKNGPTDESVWPEYPDEQIHQYPRAKTLSEQDAWRFAEESGGALELATVLASNIQGPVLGSDYSASIDLVARMLNGKMPAMPRLGTRMVDVRDLVDLHLLAMTRPSAAGERFLAAGDFLWLTEVADVLRAALGEQARKVPRRTLPDWVVRFGGRFNPELAQLAPSLGFRSTITSRKAEELLGWHPRPARQSVIDTATSLLNKGLV